MSENTLLINTTDIEVIRYSLSTFLLQCTAILILFMYILFHKVIHLNFKKIKHFQAFKMGHKVSKSAIAQPCLLNILKLMFQCLYSKL